MKRRGLALDRRLAAAAAAAVLVLSLAGDRGRAATVPALVNGQDPLEVLSLKVRPNVIVVLDSSGSMTENTAQSPNTVDTNSGDHPRSKMYQAKQVLRQVVQNNQDKVSFQMGTYTQYGMSFRDGSPGDARFQYTVSEQDAPFMGTSAELTAERADGDSGSRGLQSWQIIYPEWNTLYFRESNGAQCSATLAGTPKFYARGSDLATDLKNAMNAASCSGGSRQNTYNVTYGTGNGHFTFSSTGPNSFNLQPTATPNNISNALGGLPSSSAGGTTTITLTGVTNLRRRSDQGRIYMSSDPGLVNGDTCTISGSVMPSNPQANGTWTVTNPYNGNYVRLNGPTGSDVYATTIGTITCQHTSPPSVQSSDPYTLLYRTTGTGSSGFVRMQFTENIGGTNVRFYQLRAGRLWNGETVYVKTNGDVCGMDFATSLTKKSPPQVTLVSASSSCAAGTDSAVFVFAGARESSNSASCNGFRSKSQLIPCDLKIPPAPLQFTTISPYLDLELPFDANGDPADWDGDGNPDYVEAEDGSWATSSVNVAPSAKAAGSTPIANSLIDIKGTAKTGDTSCITNPERLYPSLDLNSASATTDECAERNFTKMWNTGPSDTGTPVMPPTLGSGPWASVPLAQRAIKNHRDPKEKTIVLFVTDGNDTCGSRTGVCSLDTSISCSSDITCSNKSAGVCDIADDSAFNFSGSSQNERRARRAAYYAEDLYTRIDPNEPASSVQTYVIGYGGAFSGTDPYLLNWIAWGGSGLGQADQPAVNWKTDSTSDVATARAQCTTCQDAFIAPDAVTLAAQLQSIIDQGASEGDFNAQQSITESVFEYVDFAPDTAGNFTFDPSIPSTRFTAIVPTRFISSFKLPGFKGQLKAYQNVGPAVADDPCDGTGQCKWDAGQKLFDLVSGGMNSCSDDAARECVFSSLPAKIARRIYTTSRNGVYTYTPADLANASWTPPERVTLWPAPAAVAPNDYSGQGSLDAALGLPADSSSDPAGEFTKLQGSYRACLGGNLPSACTSGSDSSKMKAARREARDMILAFMAGAAAVPEGTGVKRTSSNQILYKGRPWMLGDSELATPAVVTPPSLSEPDATPYVAEYRLYRDGVGAAPRLNSDAQIRQGFGLSRPDNDTTVADAGRPLLKPVMTVVYAPANDMLHAFRAGPNCVSGSRTNTCTEYGGEELWGFVPYDQLGALSLRLANEPQGRDNHVFMLARGVRFADVFVPGAASINIGGLGNQSVNGVWRRVLFFGRGIGGKYVTALDVTAPGPYTALAATTAPPIPLWNRGNPDTYSGLRQELDNQIDHDQHDYDLYRRMGETWSMPTVALVNKGKLNAHYVTSRRPDGVDFVIFMGSGYGVYNDHGLEGTTHYTLDALTGDVIAAADVEPVALAHGIDRTFPTEVPYNNALVANSVSFNRSAFESLSAKVFNTNPHPWSFVTTRVYIGDLHGRLWKFLTDSPGTAIPAADLGADQPIGTAVALLGEGPDPLTTVPNIFVTAGNDRRAQGPCVLTGAAIPCFRNFTFKDEGDDVDGTVGPTTLDGSDNTIAFAPVIKRFSRVFDQGDPEVDCDYPTEAVFRGTIQPTSAVECDAPLVGSRCEGNLLQRVFFGGTRLSLPNTKFAPPTPFACGIGDYPCRSQFDSILYALGVVTGKAAYDMNASGDQAYRIFRDSRISALNFGADPDPTRGGSVFTADEGLMKGGAPKPPPPPGIPPTATTATPNVVMQRAAGQPPPAVRYGSSVCSEQP